MKAFEIRGLTKDFGAQRGIFDIDVSLEQGRALGFLGPNGAGKTTTIRHLMGFLKAQSGSVTILGKDCFTQRADIQKHVGYLPGEVALFDEMTGIAYLQLIAKLKEVSDLRRMNELIDRFELNPSGKIKKMSKGMKQKIGIVAAFMASPQILILDEPTSGLDPLMQNIFIDLIAEEKAAGRSILISSHLFEEVERTCDEIAIIRAGRIIDHRSMREIREDKQRRFSLVFHSATETQSFLEKHPQAHARHGQVILTHSGEVESFMQELADYRIVDIQVTTPSLEEMFLNYYHGEEK